jgi:GTP cyclohydrolase I
MSTKSEDNVMKTVPGTGMAAGGRSVRLAADNDRDELPTREEAEAAIRTLIRFAGDDPTREGLRDTPKRVAKAYAEFFAGYTQDPVEVLSRTFEEVHGYDDLVMLRDIRLESTCEHHMLPIIGVAHVAYLPRDRVVGISKIARVVEIFAKRLQTQETMTAQIAEAIENALKPRGVAILIDALHQCMTTRGIHKPGTSTITTRFTGVFSQDADYRERFLRMVHGPRLMTG